MPRLSLYRPQKSNDYRYLDKLISEQYTVGATDLYVHKYIGTNNPTSSVDLTQPHYDQLDPTNIQDLLFLENRDRKYDPNIYRLRGHYNVQNLDFDLSQFGLFLTNDIIFITVHYNDMIDVIGRKLMVGDVFELPHLTDYHPLNETIPIGLRRYYQITDANFASEGFSSTWYPHMWRIKCEPLVNSQEFANILQQPINQDNYLGDWDPTKTYAVGYTVTYNGKIYTPTQPVPAGTLPTNTTYWVLSTEQNLIDIISTYNKNIEINEAVIEEAARIVPKMGYDRSQLYVVPTYTDGEPAPPVNIVVSSTTPVFPESSLMFFYSKKYKYSSAGIVIPKEDTVLTLGKKLKLSFATSAPILTATGSGPMVGDPILKIVPMASSGPYGTSDNTYITSDQHIDFIVTSNKNAVATTTISVLNLTSFMQIGLTVQATVTSENGTVMNVFPPNTVVTSFNTATNTFVVNNETLSSIPSGNEILISGNFSGENTPESDYLADWDPRFQFIRRTTPKSFGYLAGYNTGDGTAPNGESVQAGTTFPSNPDVGEYCLRLDYLPQKLFRFNGQMWVEISRNVRTSPSLGTDDQSQISSFINNTSTVPVTGGGTVQSRQSLSKALRIQED